MPFLILAFISTFYITTESCGITTHIEVAHRAASHYQHLIDDPLTAGFLIEKYQSAFQAGNPYPDSYYPSICKKGSLADVSEDTHWVPFLNATIKYIQKKYQKPYNEDAQRLIVFTLGYISHQMADISWHSLGLEQGFLSAMGFVNFHGSFTKAHSTGDFGGDVINQFELNTNYISDLGEWYVPYNDLYNIYLDLYGTEKITKTDIIECSSLLFLGRLGEQIAVSLLYADLFKKSAFLADRLNDYFLGGLDDMATWTQLSWNKFFHMLDYGVESCKLDHNIMFIDCKTPGLNKNLTLKNPLLKSIEPHYNIDKHGLDSSYYTTEITPEGVYIKSNSKYLDRFKSSLESFQLKSNTKESNSTYFITNDYASLGWSLESGDLNKDGSDDLLIGAPVYSELNSYQNGAVFGFLSTDVTHTVLFRNLDVEKEADFVIKPPSDAVSSRFGHSIVVMDINLDGFNDIIISAPSYNLEDIKYEGRVYIYFGDGQSQDYDEPSVTITCKKLQYCNLGLKLSKGDVNGDGQNDLIISSPYAATCGSQCGFVSVLLSKNNFNSEIEASELDWSLSGQMAYEWFGFSAKSKHGYLIVGSPESRICNEPNCDYTEQDLQSVGRVYLYKYPETKPTMTIYGEIELAQFGYDFDMSYQSGTLILAVSSVSEETKLSNGTSFNLNRAGVVRLYEITDKGYSFISILKSDRPYSGFGSRVQFVRLNENEEENLIISSQMRSESLILIEQIQEGLVYIFEGGKKLFENFTDNCSITSLHPCPSKHAKLVLGTKQRRSRFGFDFTLLKNKYNQKLTMAVSAIHADNKKSRLSGQVKLFLI